jgi:hypothetical protein
MYMVRICPRRYDKSQPNCILHHLLAWIFKQFMSLNTCAVRLLKVLQLNSVLTCHLPWQPQFYDWHNTQGIYGHLESICSKSLFWLCHKHTSFGCILFLLQLILLAGAHQMRIFSEVSVTHNGLLSTFYTSSPLIANHPPLQEPLGCGLSLLQALS